MIFLINCYLIFFISVLAASSNESLQVTTTNGIVEGLESVTEGNRTFYVFQGIPYAQPPVGNLRFRAPLPAENWDGVYNATYARSDCINMPYTEIKISGAEDCLFINVYTPQLPGNNSKLAVMVYIYGGGFITGSGNFGLHGADRFLDHDVVFVSFNYRLGVFGFLCTEDNVIPGNYGLKDQILALQWVQQNIEAFGGDKTKVTIFGESAGSASVHFLRQAERARGLFQRTIAQSGSTLNPWTNAHNPKTVAFRIGLFNGIWTVSTKTLIEGLRKIDANTLAKSIYLPYFLDLWDPLDGLPLAPCLEEPSDEAVFTEYSYEAQINGKFNRGALLHGFNSLEAREAAKLPWYGIILLEKYNLDTSDLTPEDMNASKNGNTVVGKQISSFYFNNKSVANDTNLVNFVSDDQFVRGIVKTSELEVQYTPVYLYRFSFTGGIEHEAFNPEGASHTEELQFLFLTNTSKQVTPEAKLTVERMLQLWTNFAKVGNPTPTHTEAVNVTWPVVNATGFGTLHYLDIGEELVLGTNPEEKQMKFWDNLYYQYGYPPYNTY